jgi:hypothetical protein
MAVKGRLAMGYQYESLSTFEVCQSNQLPAEDAN